MADMDRSHSNWAHVLFYLGLALFVGHEMDAVTRQEWQLLPLLSLLEGEVARVTFIGVHIPLFVVLFWLTGHRSATIRRRSQIGVDVVLVVHGMAHWAMSGVEGYLFEPPLETVMVFGGALVGALHLVVLLRSREI